MCVMLNVGIPIVEQFSVGSEHGVLLGDLEGGAVGPSVAHPLQTIHTGLCVCVCIRVCVDVRVHVCACVYMRVNT